MQAEIGNAAGTIWRYLDQHGETTVTKLRQETKLSDQLVLMGLGWLAKEEKLEVAKDGRTLRVALKEQRAG